MDSVCNILGKWWQNNLRWVQFQYNLSTVNTLLNYQVTVLFPVVNTRQRILLLRYKSLVIQEQLTSELHSSEKSLIKKKISKTTSNAHYCRLQTSTWGYHFHFNSTWRKTWVTANSSNSPACVSTKSTFESAAKRFPLCLDKSLPCCQVQIEEKKTKTSAGATTSHCGRRKEN